jgi:DNA primase
MIDTQALCASVDLLDVIGRDTRLRKVAGTGGGEHAGACPACKGDDRFRVWPNAERPGYWCRGCGAKGDAISYMMWRGGLAFREAVQALGGDRMPPRRADGGPPGPPTLPSAAWQARAEVVVRQAFDDLWSARGERARAYLHRRGLTDDTLRAFVVGLIPADRYDDAADWGLAADDGPRVWLPKGILTPWIERTDDEVWAIKIRRPVGDPKYWAVRGSVPTLFGSLRLVGRPTLALTEGEFDSMLLWQQASDLIDAASLGSASIGPRLDSRAARHLLDAQRVLVLLDGDAAGARGAEKLLAASARMRRVVVPDGQDITEYYLAGGDLGALVSAHLASAAPASPAARDAVQAPDAEPAVTPQDTAQQLLTWGADYGWPRLPYRQGEAIASDEHHWRAFVAGAQAEVLVLALEQAQALLASRCVILGCWTPRAADDLVYCTVHRTLADDGTLWAASSAPERVQEHQGAG